VERISPVTVDLTRWVIFQPTGTERNELEPEPDGTEPGNKWWSAFEHVIFIVQGFTRTMVSILPCRYLLWSIMLLSRTYFDRDKSL
jgi:hypothetical protein